MPPPLELGVYTPAEGDARGFQRVGDTVYLATRNGGLDVVDITDPGAAASLGSIDLDGQSVRVAVEGNTAFVGQRGGGWIAVDVTDPGTLAEVSSDDTVDAQDVAVADGTLFVVDNTGLLTYDVSDPADPMPLSSDLVLPGSTETVALVGDIAYVAANGGALSIVDVSDPAAPTVLAEVDETATGQHVWASGDQVYASTPDGVALIDASTPARAAETGFYTRDRATMSAAHGSTLFVFGTSTASTDVPFLQVVDVADVASPTELHTAFDDLADPEWTDIVDGMLLFTTDEDDALHLAEACPSR